MNLLHTKWDDHSRDRQNRVLVMLVVSILLIVLVALVAG